MDQISVCHAPGCVKPACKKGLCGAHYQRLWKYGTIDPRPSHAHCQAEDCQQPPRSKHAQYCEAHYYRLRRTGSIALADRTPPPLIGHSHGYQLLYAPGHPLATEGQRVRVYEHRAVFYAAHGGGPFQCFHCGTTVTWHDMHVDHLNDVRDDNRIDNLAPSCARCNQKRGHHKIGRTLRNRSHNQITWQGRTRHVLDWADDIGITTQALANRLRRWPIERAMTEARGKFGPKGHGCGHGLRA